MTRRPGAARGGLTPPGGRTGSPQASGARGGVAGGDGTIVQRIRARGVEAAAALVSRLPEGPLTRLAEAVGVGWYFVAPRRATRARANLRRVAQWLETTGCGPARARAAAHDDAALERLVRAAFRHQARYYLELLRVARIDARYVAEHLVIETPDLVAEAFSTGTGVIFVGAHFGAIELPALILASWAGKPATAPMETVGDPPLQRFFARSRTAVGVRLVGLESARHELRSALERGEPVGLVGDRDIAGGGHLTPFFGHPAPLPVGPALLAIETGAPVYVASVRRTGIGRYAGRLARLGVPAEGSLRERATATLEAEAAEFERLIAMAPEQWWGAFFPIWEDVEAAR